MSVHCKQMVDMYNLAVTSLLVVLIFSVYHNNRDIQKLNNSAKSANQVLEKSEVNDSYFFKSNNQMMNYLKARDGMKQDVEKLKIQVKKNMEKNVQQDQRLEKSEQIDEEHNRIIDEIKRTYRSDVNYLVNLSLTETRKHFPNDSDGDNLKKFRELLYHYVLQCFMQYTTFIQEMSLDDFLDEYSSDVSFILAESIYEFRIYNHSESFPSTIMLSTQIRDELKDPEKLSFLIKTYFPRMFTYIQNNKKRLFYELEAIESSRVQSSRRLFSNAQNSVFAQFVLKDANFEVNKVDKAVLNFLLVSLPEYYTKSLYYTSTNNKYILELESRIISSPLNSCLSLEQFYKTWLSFNLVKKENLNLLPDTEKRKLLRDLMEGNAIFKRMYEDRVKKYNDKLHDTDNCELPKLPAEFKEFYEESEIQYPEPVRVKNTQDNDRKLSNLLQLV